METVVKSSELGKREHLNPQSRVIIGITGVAIGDMMGSLPQTGQMVSAISPYLMMMDVM